MKVTAQKRLSLATAAPRAAGDVSQPPLIRWVCCLGLASLLAGGNLFAGTQTLESVVASVGNIAITSRDVEKEYRFERFLDGQWPPPPPNAAALHAARQALAYQTVLAQQENPGPTEKADAEKTAAERLAALRKEFARPDVFLAAMRDLGMTEAQLLARITQEELMLRLIDERLRSEASPNDDAVAHYYQSTFVPRFEKKNAGVAAPPLSEVAGQIREILTQQRINELLDQWLEDLRPTIPVRFYDFE